MIGFDIWCFALMPDEQIGVGMKIGAYAVMVGEIIIKIILSVMIAVWKWKGQAEGDEKEKDKKWVMYCIDSDIVNECCDIVNEVSK